MGKVKKFGIGWCIPYRVVADTPRGGSCEPSPHPIGLRFVLRVEGNTKMYEILSIKTVSLTAIQKLKLRISTFVNKNKLYKVFYNLN